MDRALIAFTPIAIAAVLVFLIGKACWVDPLTRERARLCPPGYRWDGKAKGYVNDAGHFVPWEVAADLHSRGYY